MAPAMTLQYRHKHTVPTAEHVLCWRFADKVVSTLDYSVEETEKYGMTNKNNQICPHQVLYK